MRNDVPESGQMAARYTQGRPIAPPVKPPLGIMLRSVWIRHRIHALRDAVERQFDTDKPNLKLTRMWIEEGIALEQELSDA